MARFGLQWQQCLRETTRTAAQLRDLLFQFNATPRDLIASYLDDNEDEPSGDLPNAGNNADG